MIRQPSTEAVSASLFVLLAIATTPAAGDGLNTSRIRSLAEIRQETVVMQKWDNSCGAAALATLLTYDLRDPVSERDVASAMLRTARAEKVRARGGFSLLDMQAFAQARGYIADGYGGTTLADLRKMVPAIVPVEFHGYEHFVVVRHIAREQVVFADPAYGKRTLPVSDFEKAWHKKVAFVIAIPNAAR
jgi:uncharacterized protein